MSSIYCKLISQKPFIQSPLLSVSSRNWSQMDSSTSPPQERLNTDDQTELPNGGSGEKRKETVGGSGATSQPSKVRKSLPTRSSASTSNLKKHLGICKQYKAWKDSQAERQPIINIEGNLKIAKVPESVFREASNEMIVIGELPLSFIESAAWRHFCNKMNLYKPLSRRTATRDVVELYVQRKTALKKWFASNNQRVSLTTDIWTCQPTGLSYMVVTAHYIDQSWTMKKLIIGFKHITDHKGQTISTVLLECLADWGIKRVFCITVDNASANSFALRKFESSFKSVSDDSLVLDGEFLHMRCSAHILNLIVRDGLVEVGACVSAIRNAISFVRSSSNRQKTFELKVDSGRISRGSIPLDVKPDGILPTLC